MTKATLARWIKEGKIPEPARDPETGWPVWLLAKKMASSWAAFAASGKPSIPREPSHPETNKTVIWDNDCRMVNDPEGEARKIILD